MRRVLTHALVGLFCAGALAACAQSPALEDAFALDGSTTDLSPSTTDDMDAGDAPVVQRTSDGSTPGDAGPSDAAMQDSGRGTPVAEAGLDGGGAPEGPVVVDSGPTVPVDPVVADSGPAVPVVPVAPTCAAATTLCGSACVDLATDAANCGSCANSCNGTACAASVCAKPVPAGCTVTAYGSHSYLFCAQLRGWSDAREACRAEQLDMTVINDAAENEFVRGAGGAWIGASDLDAEGSWRALAPGVVSRTDGPMVSYTNWPTGEPSNTLYCAGVATVGDCRLATSSKVDEDCAYMTDDGSWDDMRCGLPLPFVCESP